MIYRKQFDAIWPIRWAALAFVLMCCTFPIVGMFYLMFDVSSMPWLTRALFLLYVGLWMYGISGALKRPVEVNWLDVAIGIYFLSVTLGYFRSGFPGSGFEYMLALNLIPYLIGRFSLIEDVESILNYVFMIASAVTLLFLVSLPELYHSWAQASAWLQHPTLYGFISTVGGLDVVMGMLPVLAAVIYIICSEQNSPLKSTVLIIAVMLGSSLLLLISSRSAYAALLGTLLFIMLVGFTKKTAKYVAALLISVVVAAALTSNIAPENNIKFNTQWKIDSLHKVPSSISGQGYGEVDETDSAAVRLVLWGRAITHMMDSPLMGIGPKEWTYEKPHPHNVVLESGQSFGVLSVVSLLGFFAMMLFSTRVSEAISLRQQVIRSSIWVLCIYMLFYNLVQGQLGSFRSLPLFLLCGLVSGLVGNNQGLLKGFFVGYQKKSERKESAMVGNS